MAFMERLEDKAIVLLCCLPAFALMGAGTAAGAMALCAAVALSAVYELTAQRDATGKGVATSASARFPFGVSLTAPVVQCVLAALVPVAGAFVPLAVYDLARNPRRWVLGIAVIPLTTAFVRMEGMAAGARAVTASAGLAFGADAVPLALVCTVAFCLVAF